MNEKDFEYVAPQVEVVEVAVERGMEMSLSAGSVEPDGYVPGEWE